MARNTPQGVEKVHTLRAGKPESNVFMGDNIYLYDGVFIRKHAVLDKCAI